MEIISNLAATVDDLFRYLSWLIFVAGGIVLVWKVLPSREDIEDFFSATQEGEVDAHEQTISHRAVFKSRSRAKDFGTSNHHPHKH